LRLEQRQPKTTTKIPASSDESRTTSIDARAQTLITKRKHRKSEKFNRFPSYFFKGEYLNGELLNTIKAAHYETPFKLASLDETHLAVGYSSYLNKLGKNVQIFNWKTGGEFGKLTGHTRDVLALAKLDDGYLASGSCDLTIKIWAWKSGREVKNLTGHKDEIYDLLPIRNFSQVVSCAADKTIKVWNRSNGQVLKTLTAHTQWVKTVILLKSGHLASASGDWTIGIWNLTNGIRIQNLTGHSGAVQSLINLNKSQMASCGRDWKIKIWTTKTYQEVKTITGHSNSVNALVYLPNGNLASASSDKTIRIWDLDRRERPLIKTIFAHSEQVSCLTLLEDGNFIASGSHDEAIKIWHFHKKSNNYSAGWFTSFFLG
jgi:WD40 repeat protein